MLSSICYSSADYSTSTTNFPDRLRSLQQLIINDTWPSDTPLGVGLTEYNVRTAGDYDSMTKTLDDAYDSSALGGVSTQVTLALPAHLYAFKFAQTTRSSGAYPVVKNGLLYVDNTVSVGRYGGTTKGAEIWRLFGRATQPGRTLRNCAFSSDIASYSSSSGVYCLASTQLDQLSTYLNSSITTHRIFIVNSGTSSSTKSIDLNVSTLFVASSSSTDSLFAYIVEVSPMRTGNVVWSGILPATRVLTALSMPASSAWLMTVTNVPALTAIGMCHEMIVFEQMLT